MRLRSASKIRTAGLVSLFLDSGLHFADGTEAPAASARVVDSAPSVTADGRWAATWASSQDAARASASGLVMSSHSLLFRGIKEAEAQLAKQLLYGLKAACHPLPNSAAGETESGRRLQ